MNVQNHIAGSVGQVNNVESATRLVNNQDPDGKYATVSARVAPRYQEMLCDRAEWEGRKLSAYIRNALYFYETFAPDPERPYREQRDIRPDMIKSRDDILDLFA